MVLTGINISVLLVAVVQYFMSYRFSMSKLSHILLGVGSDEDSQLRELGRFLSAYSLHHAAPALLPRGLTNR
jgi:hypothetical protein